MIIDIGTLNWKLLREQKRSLIEMRVPAVTAEQEQVIEGILNLIDRVQDQAVERGHATEKEVFGA